MSKLDLNSKIIKRLDEILEKHGLKKTQLRRNILLAFSETKKSLSQAELIDALSRENANIDRVSVYRNLASLSEAGVIHQVDFNNYIFCSHNCEDHAHLLLFCQNCQKHQEVKDHDRISKFLSALSGLQFFGQQQPIFLRGVCTSCSPN